MGKAATTAAPAMKRKKKKGRPPKNKDPLSHSSPPKPLNYDSTHRRSVRRNPNSFNSPPPEFDSGDDDDERKEKKVKLVVRLPQSDEIGNNQKKQLLKRPHSGSESEDRDVYAKKRKINAADRGSSGASVPVQEKKVVKVTDTSVQGSPLELSGPTTPLPDKKLLVFILDRLQKKDTYGVFSEPVDINELPDYFEIIEQPMDFGTVRKKLHAGAYKTLEQLEADVFLICSNAMQYNAQDTVYYRQARTIQDLAKRDFENLRHEGDDGEPQPKIVRRGRPPGNKNQKKSLETSPIDRVGPALSSGATLTTGEDKAAGSNSYNLRKGNSLYKYRSSDLFVSPFRSRNGENYSEWLVDWNDEFPASILRADMKHAKRQFTVDETRRDTYRQFHPPLSSNNSPVLSGSVGDMKRLVPVGLQEPLVYARSLARYAADLGPVAWKIASRKIESVLPAGLQYGPGWVGEDGVTPPPPLSQPISFSTDKQKSSNSSAGDCNSSRLLTVPNTPELSSAVAYGASELMAEAVRKLNSQNELVGLQRDGVSSWRTPFSFQQKPVYQQAQRNGFGGMFGNMNHAIQEEANKMPENRNAQQAGYPPQTWTFGQSTWPVMPAQQRTALSVPPDLNVRIPVGSPSSSSLQIGSPQQQPDLALQL